MLQHHQVNAFFVEGPHKIAALGSTEDAHNGTWVGSMGFKINGQKIQVDTDNEGAMTGDKFSGNVLVDLNLKETNQLKRTRISFAIHASLPENDLPRSYPTSMVYRVTLCFVSCVAYSSDAHLSSPH